MFSTQKVPSLLATLENEEQRICFMICAPVWCSVYVTDVNMTS